MVDIPDVVGEALVRLGKATPESLVAACEGSDARYAAAALRAARYVRAEVDSPMETRLRMLIVLAGLPEPEVNVVVRKDGGEWSRRFDLCYPQLKLIIEYDGLQHLRDRDQWSRDLDWSSAEKAFTRAIDLNPSLSQTVTSYSTSTLRPLGERDEALRLLSLPREVGRHPDDGEPILANFGRFGPYVKRGDEFRSLAGDEQVFTVTLDDALSRTAATVVPVALTYVTTGPLA